MKFIDLFAGLGGFHLALRELGHECVFASEIEPSLIELYFKNFGIKPSGDITKIKIEDIPEHQILCAGFPCTPFSKAGKRQGRDDLKNGKLFDEIVRILKHKKPHYFILENVSSLFYHDKNKTWSYIEKKLHSELGYTIDKRIYSPHEFGIPQYRRRLFIVGSKSGLSNFDWIDFRKSKSESDIHSILEKNNTEIKKINKKQNKCINVWQKFLDAIPKEQTLEFPIWAAEFGATYPYEKDTPFSSSTKLLKTTKGAFGVSLKNYNRDQIFDKLPSYAREEVEHFPDWKVKFIKLNREFYKKYKRQLIGIIPLIKNLEIPSWQKFEWNCQSEKRVIKNYILQFRASGLRVKKNNFAPSLVCPSTQRPIIGWEKRYITRGEALKLQSMQNLKYLPEGDGAYFRALGNALNVNLVKYICQELLK